MKKLIVIVMLMFVAGCCNSHLKSPEDGDKAPLDQVGDVVGALRTTNAATAPFNPYAGLIEGVLGAVAVGLGALGVKQRRNLTTVGRKYEAHKRGVESIMREAESEIAENIYNAIGHERAKLKI